MTAPGADERLSDAELASFKAGLQEGHWPARSLGKTLRMIAELQRHRAAAEAVEKLHAPVTFPPHSNTPYCTECSDGDRAEAWPCETIKTLGGEA